MCFAFEQRTRALGMSSSQMVACQVDRDSPLASCGCQGKYIFANCTFGLCGLSTARPLSTFDIASSIGAAAEWGSSCVLPGWQPNCHSHLCFWCCGFNGSYLADAACRHHPYTHAAGPSQGAGAAANLSRHLATGANGDVCRCSSQGATHLCLPALCSGGVG